MRRLLLLLAPRSPSPLAAARRGRPHRHARAPTASSAPRGADRLVGRGGDDRLRGRGGNDTPHRRPRQRPARRRRRPRPPRAAAPATTRCSAAPATTASPAAAAPTSSPAARATTAIDVRDGGRDRVTCGPGRDPVRADARDAHRRRLRGRRAVSAPARRAPVVLLVDDDAAIRRSGRRGARARGLRGRPRLRRARRARGGRVGRARGRSCSTSRCPTSTASRCCARLRERGDDVPVCVLSARDEVDDRVRGLEAGADDYVVKPFALEEVAARLHALLRRRPRRAGRAARGRRHRARPRAPPRAPRRPRPRADAPRVRAARALPAPPRRGALSRRALHEEVWGYTFDPGTNVADVFVGYLRRKLEAGGEPRVLHTVRGVGFVLQP